MAISGKKRRYSITLTPSVVERFHGFCKEFNMPQNTMSNVCNDAIMQISEVFVTAKKQGKFSLEDLFRLMGQQVDLIINEEKEGKNVRTKQERNPVSEPTR